VGTKASRLGGGDLTLVVRQHEFSVNLEGGGDVQRIETSQISTRQDAR
jgi:hypothetical protein